MSDLVAVADGKIFIGGPMTVPNRDMTEADFDSQSSLWTEIDGWETRGPLGDSYEIINTPLINRGRNSKSKGTADAPDSEQNFVRLSPPDPGQAKLIAAGRSRSGFAFRILNADIADPRSMTATVTIAAPGVFTAAAHGLLDGTAVRLTTTGTLPTGLVAATTYYVVASATNTIQLSATKGGAPITTTGSQTGVHTVTTVPKPTTELIVALVTGTPIEGGPANANLMLKSMLSVQSNHVVVEALG